MPNFLRRGIFASLLLAYGLCFSADVYAKGQCYCGPKKKAIVAGVSIEDAGLPGANFNSACENDQGCICNDVKIDKGIFCCPTGMFIKELPIGKRCVSPVVTAEKCMALFGCDCNGGFIEGNQICNADGSGTTPPPLSLVQENQPCNDPNGCVCNGRTIQKDVWCCADGLEGASGTEGTLCVKPVGLDERCPEHLGCSCHGLYAPQFWTCRATTIDPPIGSILGGY